MSNWNGDLSISISGTAVPDSISPDHSQGASGLLNVEGAGQTLVRVDRQRRQLTVMVVTSVLFRCDYLVGANTAYTTPVRTEEINTVPPAGQSRMAAVWPVFDWPSLSVMAGASHPSALLIGQ